MTTNGLGPTSTAIEDGAQKFDQPDSKTDLQNNSSASRTQAQLITTIKAHIAKGDKAAEKAEQHYIAAGQHLKTLKAAHTGTWDEWETLLKTEIGIGKSRASELMQISDGTKTLIRGSAPTLPSERRMPRRGLSSPLVAEKASTSPRPRPRR